MGLDVDPRPAELPLPGGQPGATVELEPLLAGEVRGPAGYFELPSGPLARLRAFAAPRGRWAWYPIPAFLVRHPGAGALLIDTGLHQSVATAPAQNMGTLYGRFLFKFRFESEQALVRALPRRGIAVEDVRTVVMTHLHLDHASAISDFPQATFVVSKPEWEAAAEPRGELRGYVRRQFDHAFDWRTIDYDRPEVDSFATFGRSVDLFGDGSVRLLFTPGHTLGHQSVLLRLEGREALLTGDAAYTLRTISEDVMPLLTADAHLFRRSRRELRGFVEQTPNLVVIPGHDPEAWLALEPSYA